MKKAFLIFALSILPACGLTYDLDSVPLSSVGGVADMDSGVDLLTPETDMQVDKSGDVNAPDLGPKKIITNFEADRPNKTYTIGETIVFTVETNRPGSLALEITKSNGQTFKLIPSVQEENPVPIEANVPLTLPPPGALYNFSAGAPRGEEKVQVSYLNENGILIESAQLTIIIE